MSFAPRKLFDVDDLTTSEILSLFNKTKTLKRRHQQGESLEDDATIRKPSLLNLFFEPSTRTQLSFQQAAGLLGFRVLSFDPERSSLSKGESPRDTLRNIAALQFAGVIFRSNTSLEWIQALKETSLSVLNAGYSTESHPTQALLDAFTILENLKRLQKIKILFVGDARHSRVFQSHTKLSKILGYEVGLCAPSSFMESHFWTGVYFENLKDGLSWCDVCEGLRVQKERHQTQSFISLDGYFEKYGLRKENFSFFKKEGLILHPGPFNEGIDFDSAFLNDERVKLDQQVTNGLYLRAALMTLFFGNQVE